MDNTVSSTTVKYDFEQLTHSFQLLDGIKDLDGLLTCFRETIQKIIPIKCIALFEYDIDEKKHFIVDVFPLQFKEFVEHQLEEGIIAWAQLHREVFISETEFFYDEFSSSKSIFIQLFQNSRPIGLIEILPEDAFNPDIGKVKSQLEILGAIMSDKVEILKLTKEIKEKQDNLARITTQFENINKMASLGELAGSIAHEINNPMTTILGRIQLMLEFNSLPGDVQKKLTVIEAQANRISKLIHALLSFSRGKDKESIDEEMDINQVIINSLELTRHDLAINHIEVSTALANNLPHIYGDSIQIQQVFINLINNARHAMRKKGKLSIGSRIYESSICVSIKDNGYGIDPKDHTRIFEPLFTTKRKSGGTGLGLSICRQIIQKHNGSLSVESKLHKGTQFDIYFPIVKQKSNGVKRK